jgi:hypothetical protein
VSVLGIWKYLAHEVVGWLATDFHRFKFEAKLNWCQSVAKKNVEAVPLPGLVLVRMNVGELACARISWFLATDYHGFSQI